MSDATRLFGGKIYKRWNHAPTKASAKELARQYRKQGYLARVAENDKSWKGTENAWAIWLRGGKRPVAVKG